MVSKKICMNCGKISKKLSNGLCSSCLKLLSLETPSFYNVVKGKPKNWNVNMRAWKAQRGNGICEKCFRELSKSNLVMDPDYGFTICRECQEKKKKTSKKSERYWKGKQPTIRNMHD